MGWIGNLSVAERAVYAGAIVVAVGVAATIVVVSGGSGSPQASVASGGWNGASGPAGAASAGSGPTPAAASGAPSASASASATSPTASESLLPTGSTPLTALPGVYAGQWVGSLQDDNGLNPSESAAVTFTGGAVGSVVGSASYAQDGCTYQFVLSSASDDQFLIHEESGASGCPSDYIILTPDVAVLEERVYDSGPGQQVPDLTGFLEKSPADGLRNPLLITAREPPMLPAVACPGCGKNDGRGGWSRSGAALAGNPPR
jgi:hypothetical protein